MKDRPFFSKSLRELETLANIHWNSIESLRPILHELSFRSKNSANQAKQNIKERIDFLDGRPSIDFRDCDDENDLTDESSQVSKFEELSREQLPESPDDPRLDSEQGQVMNNSHVAASDEVSLILDDLRKRLLDLTRRNRLLNFRHTKGMSLRVIDELPNQLVETLFSDTEMKFEPVPEPTKIELIDAGYLEVNEETGQTVQILPNPTAQQWASYLALCRV